MDGHETAPHTQTSRRLGRNDRSRYALVRLTVTRTAAGHGVVSVVVRDVRGGMLRDTRLHAATIDLSPGTAGSVQPLVALRDALSVLLEKAAVER